MIKFNSLVFLLILSSFHLHSQDLPKPSKDTLLVSFISIGAGTDHKAEDRLRLLVKDFELKNKVQFIVTIRNWGREGETDYSYDLTTLSKKQCKDFVDRITKMFQENNLVKIRRSSHD